MSTERERRKYLSEPWRKARLLARLNQGQDSLSDSRRLLRKKLLTDPHISPRLLNQASWWLIGRKAERSL